jgi:hypothetical protein
MSAGGPGQGPEWITAHVFDAVQYSDDGPRRVRLRVGIVRLPHGAGRRIASQADDRDVFVLPPTAAARIIGVLRDGLTEL